MTCFIAKASVSHRNLWRNRLLAPLVGTTQTGLIYRNLILFCVVYGLVPSAAHCPRQTREIKSLPWP
jgi:hypothetical protein